MSSAFTVYFSGGILFNSLGMISTAKLKRSGDNTAPCGVPLAGRVIVSDVRFPSDIVAVLFDRKFWIYLYVLCPGFDSCKFLRIAECLTLSNALWRSRARIAAVSKWFAGVIISCLS